MSKASKRLNTAHQVDLNAPIRFVIGSKVYQGYKGDTVASALLANGEKIVGRSFKLHRPRGVMTAGCEEPNALLQVESGLVTEPNVRATTTPLYPGFVANGQNAWPNVKFDLFGLMNVFQKMLPASFYYKSLMWPSWHVYEGLVRRLAGLGKAPREAGPYRYHKRNAHCDVLICGGGVSGLMSALVAAESGLRVMLLDEQPTFGGRLNGESQQIDGKPAANWIKAAVAKLESCDNVTLLSNTTVTGYYEQNFLTAAERLTYHMTGREGADKARERHWRIRARRVILATGAIERPLVFPNNDRPSIMLASAVREYANRYGVAVGQSIVVITNNDSAYECALDLSKAGMNVSAIVDTRVNAEGSLQQAARAQNIPLYLGYTVGAVHGSRSVKGVTLAKHRGNGEMGELEKRIACDVVAMSGGWTPTVHLHSQAGGKLRYDDSRLCLVPEITSQAVSSVGAANGQFALSECFTSATQGALEAVREVAGIEVTPPQLPSVVEVDYAQPEAYWYTKGARTDKQWIDFQYDVKVSDLELAARENFVSVEHVKRYTTNGMSLDQGKTSNVNALAVMSELLGKPIPEVGTTKFRPPYHPSTLGAYGGLNVRERYAPRQLMPAHSWHIANNAHMEDFGGWMRPACYPEKGETEAQAISREVLAVREKVGLFESSPLGKIEVSGPDAAAFLNKIYINNLKTLKVGRARYGLITNENGVVIDDGVVVRLAEDHFLLHTTSGGAARISQWMEEWLQCEWLDLNVLINNVTTQWASITVAGLKARSLVEKLQSSIDFAAEAFPHMTFQTGEICGVPARILRASFSGEVSYEINIPANYGLALWKHLLKEGADLGVTPYGVESLMVLRMEKGLLHVGADTDGTTNPLDLGWGGAIAKKEDDFIGRRSLLRPEDQREDRLQFVGIEALNPNEPMTIGGHIVLDKNPALPTESHGYVTSACLSPTLKKSLGLGIVAGARNRIGEKVFVFANGKTVAAKLVSPTHYDPEGVRVNA